MEPNSIRPDDGQQASDKESYSLKELGGDILDVLETVFVAFFFVTLVFTFLFCIANVEGDSMVPTLQDSDRLVVSRLSKNYDDGDILIIYGGTSYMFDASGTLRPNPGLNKRIVKRLIAQGGQEVNIDFSAGVVYVDGTALDEPYISGPTRRDYQSFQYPFTVPEGYVFVLGDNRSISKDSRHPDVGLVAVDDIVGKVIIRILPLSKAGRVN
ncbi:MAG: signal peptidase I [Oscillospiraceae bacterium]|nr:signal peptidase I [Oscillospiraceae bacterium]